ncbi:Cobyric acid synthase [Gossypium australe]|uniref:Cobyric acid synthase n=1 Tax=Gossypium australe TaxID=47621 RepID=A0A5B6UDC9_9ROSI|nr:Cobyric acid synthase [Gossypium australe]
MPMDRTLQSESMRSPTVLSIECLKGSSKADEWTGDMLQTGDIVEEIRIGSGSGLAHTAPFKGGRSGVQRVLHSSYKNKETSILVRVRRGNDEFAQLQACIVPNESGGKKQYMLRSIADPNYAVGFLDRTESECFELQGEDSLGDHISSCYLKDGLCPQADDWYAQTMLTGLGFECQMHMCSIRGTGCHCTTSRSSRMVSELSRTRLQDGYVSYAWERRMQEVLAVPSSSSFLSILLLPKASDRVASRYNDLEDTLARANAWLSASQASGVPIVFMNIQTESLLTKISGETASSTVNAGSLSDLSNLANASLYGFEDYHGVDIGVVRAVRLWYSPLVEEVAIEIKLKEDDTKLGFAISRTEEGFIYISSVIDDDENVPSTRSGLSTLYKESVSASRLLVVSRLSNQKVLPWMVSSTGAIRCFDTVSLSQKLSLHRHASIPILMHIFSWDQSLVSRGSSSAMNWDPSPSVLPLPQEVRLAHQPNDNQVLPLPPGEPNESITTSEQPDRRLQRDTAGEVSFRFHNFSLPNNWV